MGRKKSNARSLPHGKKIHVNKYITKRGNTKKKVTVFEVPSGGNTHPTFEELGSVPTDVIFSVLAVWFVRDSVCHTEYNNM